MADTNIWSVIMSLRDSALILGGWVMLALGSGALVSLVAKSLSI